MDRCVTSRKNVPPIGPTRTLRGSSRPAVRPLVSLALSSRTVRGSHTGGGRPLAGLGAQGLLTRGLDLVHRPRSERCTGRRERRAARSPEGIRQDRTQRSLPPLRSRGALHASCQCVPNALDSVDGNSRHLHVAGWRQSGGCSGESAQSAGLSARRDATNASGASTTRHPGRERPLGTLAPWLPRL